ncbi:hypothetical protein AB0H00_11860 [Nocardia sp. NPDC023852]|uniref:hypothetical protein n=1 Tax=Nocardia sp. NPDC023852 TaxID=3154697 RepID=UPI0033F66641
MSLDDLSVLFTEASDRTARRNLLRAHRDQLARRVAQATAALDTLSHALDCDAEDFRSCLHFQAKVADVLTLTTTAN